MSTGMFVSCQMMYRNKMVSTPRAMSTIIRIGTQRGLSIMSWGTGGV